MKKRILSLVLAIAMCFSMVSVFAANNEAELMGELGDMVDNYRDRIWTWQANQFDAMTEEQVAVIDNAWASYEANKDAVKAIAANLAEDLATDELLANETMMDLYKWKLMRDIMEGRIDVTSSDELYQNWLARFTAYEVANDEAVSPSAPVAALDGLDDYSDDLSVFFDEFAALVDGELAIELEGEDADKAELYVAAYNAEGSEYPAGFAEALKADVVELAAEGMFNAFDLGMQVATNQVNKDNSTGLFEEIPDRDMKGAFLILGKEFSEYLVDAVPAMKKDLISMNKEDLIATVAGANGTGIVSADSSVAAEAMYDVMAAAAEYVAVQDFCQEAVNRIADEYGIAAAELINDVVDAVEEAMAVVDARHGLELVHFNTYVGRELLRYENGEEWTKLSGAVIDGETVTELTLGYGHDRYLAISKLNELPVSLAEFDANYDADGIVVNTGDEESPVGKLYIEVTEDANGTATVDVYRGYAWNGEADDAYRYVTSFAVAAEGIEYEVELDDVTDVTVDGMITVKGTTNLDYVTVSISKDGETIYAVVYSKAEFEAGIAIMAPADAVVGDVYTVTVGTERAYDTDDFAIVEEVIEYTVELEDVANTTPDGTILVKGTTNLDYVTVAIVKGEQTVYAVVYSKAEFEAGITLNAPAGAVIGDVYTVAVGTELASDTDDFEIVEIVYEVELDEIADITVDGMITVKGTTNLDYVTVSILKGSETIYAVVYTKAEFEAGIAIMAPDGAVVGDVYTVVVGTELASDTEEFTIIEEVYEYTVELEDIADTTVDGSILIKGTTNLDYVTVAILKGEVTIYAVVYTKAELEAGITLNVPENAVVGDVYTVAVGTELASDTVEFTIIGEPVPAPSLKLAGDTDNDGVMDRTVKKGSTIDITTTPQNVPEGSTAEVVWTITNAEGEVELVRVTGDYNNILQIKGITVGSGVVITGTLYIDGVATDATVTINVTVKKKSGGISTPTERPTEPTDDVVKPHVCQWPDIAATATKSAHWAHETIDQMTINGYIKGYEDGTFKPDQNITRAEFSALVYRILGLEEAEDGVLYDDTVGHWAEDIIATMSLPEGYGMLRGYGDGNFGPNDLITREQAVAIIARAKSAVWVEATEGAKDVFTDAEDISWWFDGEMDAAVANGLITGYEDGSYKPLNYTTRAEACVLLARAWPEIVE